jgi:hypothetical protein
MVAFALLIVPAVLVRLWLINHFPEPDTDAPGHLGIARALLTNPTNVALHWVWLPAYHFLLAGLLGLGMTPGSIRVFNCVLASLVPVLIVGYGEATARQPQRGLERFAPWMAAAFSAISPLVTLLGTSAQQETVFTLLVLGAIWAIDVERFALGGAILGVASLIRYEAWGGVALILAFRVVGAIPGVYGIRDGRLEALRRACSVPLVVAIPSIVTVGGWLLAHRLTEGSYLGFLREIFRYTHLQADTLHPSPWWFPVEQPLYVFGWMVLGLAAIGIRRVWRPSYLLPVGIYAFLVGANLCKAALGSARYYESLTPYVALAAAHGACILGERRKWIAPALFAAASWQLVGLSEQLCRWTWPAGMSGGTMTASSPASPAASGAPARAVGVGATSQPPAAGRTQAPHPPTASRR